jgi:hypothetical protein
MRGREGGARIDRGVLADELQAKLVLVAEHVELGEAARVDVDTPDALAAAGGVAAE